MKTKRISAHTLFWLLILLMASPPLLFAQNQPAQPATNTFSQEELAQMLAPIALYPDSLLSQVLMAATYPLEVVQADRWVMANKNLKGDQLNDALDQKGWDPSVKALVPFPNVLSMMSEKLEWTENLGDAFLSQQDQVMDTIQQLRAKAQAAGNLGDNEHEKVIVQERVIVIEPAFPDVIFVPVYDPLVVYGPWWFPAFPPISFFFPPPPGIVIVRGCWFRPRIVVGPVWVHGWGHWDWHHHTIHVNINRTININRNLNINRTNIKTTQWHHDVTHRKGVPYRNEATWKKYGGFPKGQENRRNFRGFDQGNKIQKGPGAAKTPKGLPESKTGKGSKGPGTVQKDFSKGKGSAGAFDPSSRRGFDRRSFENRRDRNVFGGMGRGSDIRMQSQRGFQSRQNMFSRGAGNLGRGRMDRNLNKR